MNKYILIIVVASVISAAPLDAQVMKKVAVLDFINMEKNQAYQYLEASITGAVKTMLTDRFVFKEMAGEDIARTAGANYLYREDYYTRSVAMNLGLLAGQDVVISGGFRIEEKNKQYAIITDVRIIDISKRKVISEFRVSGPADDRIWESINGIAQRIAEEVRPVLPNREEWQKKGFRDDTGRKAVFSNPVIGLRAGGYFYSQGWAEYFNPRQPVLGLTIGAGMPVIWDKFSVHFEFYYFSHSLREGDDSYVQHEDLSGTTGNFLFGLYPALDFRLYNALYMHPKIGAGLVLQVTDVSGPVSSNFYNSFAFAAAGLDFSYRINPVISVLVSITCVMEIEEDVLTLASVYNAGVAFRL